jgi:hypothetical protein
MQQNTLIRIRNLEQGWKKMQIQSTYYQFFLLKILKFFDADLDPGSCNPGSWMEKVGFVILDKHPGSTTLQGCITESTKAAEPDLESGRNYVCGTGIPKAISGSLVHLDNYCRHY